MSRKPKASPDVKDAAASGEKALIPAVTRVDERRVKTGFWPKIRKFAGKIPFAADALALWWCARDPETPRGARAMMIGALAYFVLPTDAIPDVLAGVGFTDDAAVIAAVIGLVSRHLKPRHRKAARAWLTGEANEASARAR